MTDDFATQAVLARIGWGRDHADSISAIAEALQTSRRSVELAVRALRLDGKPIASAGDGVWLTTDPAELIATFESLRGRVRSQMVTAWAVRQTARRMRAAATYQETLFPAA